MSELEDWDAELELRAREAGELFAHFIKTVARLRHPKSGCPWDLAQDHKSLRRYMLEEAYEASSAMLGDDPLHLLEELGDVLLQVVLNAQVSKDLSTGDIRKVIELINAKMIRRHPHVFSDSLPETISVAEIKSTWERIKLLEKEANGRKQRLFEDVTKVNPALSQAYKIGKKSAEINFDWANLNLVWEHFKSEVEELEHEIQALDREKVREELGDVFFTLAQVSRHLDIEPEAAAQEGNDKFLRRFAMIEDILRGKGLEVNQISAVELEKLWSGVKKNEKNSDQ